MSQPSDVTAGESRPGRRARILLSLFIALHWGAIAVYVAPASADGIRQLPEWVQPAARVAVAPVAHALWPVVAPYLDLTSTRQSWTLFAPYPADWIPNVHAVAYFAAEDSLGPGWQVDTLVLRGGDEEPYPHFLGHRAQRNLHQLGYAGGGGMHYRAVVARELCRSVSDGRGRLPDGIGLFAVWRRIRAPWEVGPVDEPYRQHLGGFTCDAEEARVRRRPVWVGYGLPEVVQPSSGLVRATAAPTSDTAPAPQGPR